MFFITRYSLAKLATCWALFWLILIAFAPAQAKPADVSAFTLTPEDARLYQRIFTLNVRGERTQALALSQRLKDKSLLNWAGIGDNPASTAWREISDEAMEYISPLPRDVEAQKAAEQVHVRVVSHIQAGRLDWAEETLDTAFWKNTLDRVEMARLMARVAGAYLYNNDSPQALKLAHLALQMGGQRAPYAGWVAGLASWRLEQYALSARYFSWVPRSGYAGSWMRSGAAYWTARALARSGQYAQVSAWLLEASRHSRSFYGLIATRMLGARFDFDWDVPEFSVQHAKILEKHEGAVRALKLAQAKQMDMAQAELSLVDTQSYPALRQALAALASTALAPDLAMHVAAMLQTPLGGALDTALYPLSPWHPKGGYRVDPALLNAFVRQESNFKPMAQNKGSGATGLMQLMPNTAKSVDKNIALSDLTKPEASLALGQKYLENLLDMTDGNLFEAAIAYNAGPTRLQEWKRRFADVDDALLFIELIPYRETRAYVGRVMANYWIYSLRMGHDVLSLDEVAAGRIATYAPPTNKGSDMLAFEALP